MVGRLLSFWGPAYFRGRTVSFRDDIVFVVEINFFGLLQLMKSQQFPNVTHGSWCSWWDFGSFGGYINAMAGLSGFSRWKRRGRFFGCFFGCKGDEATQKDLENTLKLFTKKLSLGIPFWDHPKIYVVKDNTYDTYDSNAVFLCCRRCQWHSLDWVCAVHQMGWAVRFRDLDTVDCDFHPMQSGTSFFLLQLVSGKLLSIKLKNHQFLKMSTFPHVKFNKKIKNNPNFKHIPKRSLGVSHLVIVVSNPHLFSS